MRISIIMLADIDYAYSHFHPYQWAPSSTSVRACRTMTAVMEETTGRQVIGNWARLLAVGLDVLKRVAQGLRWQAHVLHMKSKVEREQFNLNWASQDYSRFSTLP